MRQLLKHGMLAAILSLALPLSAQAWGPEGHEIVSEIALFHLTPAARAAVDDVLGAYKLSHYDVASWPDAIRGSKEYAELYPRTAAGMSSNSMPACGTTSTSSCARRKTATTS